MVGIIASEVKNNMRSMKKDSIVPGRVLRRSTDALNCGERKQVALVVSASRALVRVCKTDSGHITADCVGLCTYASVSKHRTTLLV